MIVRILGNAVSTSNDFIELLNGIGVIALLVVAIP